MIDFQPPTGYKDIGKCYFEDGVLMEEGVDT